MGKRFISDIYREAKIITPVDDSHYFFGYYDLRASQGKRHLCHRVKFMDRLPEEGDVAELGYDFIHPWQESAGMPYDLYLQK